METRLKNAKLVIKYALLYGVISLMLGLKATFHLTISMRG